MTTRHWNRREVLAVGAAMATLPVRSTAEPAHPMRTKTIPTSGEKLPVVGLGTYNVFDVASTAVEIAQKKEIVDLLVDAGGSVIDSSPMYNRSEKMIGDVIDAGVERRNLFIATKVWTDNEKTGAAQIVNSAQLMRADAIDLMQVHNLRNSYKHMDTIRRLQDEKRIRYSGLTHYTAGAHDALEREMRELRPQFIQINYSLGEREAEQRLLPAAQDSGVAVIINRPFQSGRLFSAVGGKTVPDWAAPFAASWGQFFLKFIVSHPAVTCTIPATSKAHHMLDNAGAGQGPLPDTKLRKRMADYIADI